MKPGLQKEALIFFQILDLLIGLSKKTFECADLDFTNFDKEKHKSFFKIGQVLTANDTFDSMPRSMQSSGRFFLDHLNCTKHCYI